MAKNMIKTGARCPQCGFYADAEISPRKYRFLIFRCPCCDINIVCYAGKTDVLSDELVDTMFHHNKLKYCGQLQLHDKPVQPGISDDDINNLKILLHTEHDSGRIIASL